MSFKSVPTRKPTKEPNPDLMATPESFPEVNSPITAPRNGPMMIPNGGKKNKPITYFNNIAPVVRAISGYEIMNRTKINYYPRRSNKDTEEQADIMSDAVEYIQDDSNFFTESRIVTERFWPEED